MHASIVGMFNEAWIAVVVGILGGPLLAYVAARWLIGRFTLEHVHPQRIRFAQLGALLAALPAFFLAIVFGGVGAAFGEAAFGSLGVLLGLACGIAIVFGAVLLLGVVLGLLAAAAVARSQNRGAT